MQLYTGAKFACPNKNCDPNKEKHLTLQELTKHLRQECKYSIKASIGPDSFELRYKLISQQHQIDKLNTCLSLANKEIGSLKETVIAQNKVFEE